MAADNRSTRRWWMVMGLGAVSCASCCEIAPILIAAGFAGAGGLLLGASWLEPLGVAIMAVAVLALMTAWLRTVRRRRDDGCGTASTCGCTSNNDDENNSQQATATET